MNCPKCGACDLGLSTKPLTAQVFESIGYVDIDGWFFHRACLERGSIDAAGSHYMPILAFSSKQVRAGYPQILQACLFMNLDGLKRGTPAYHWFLGTVGELWAWHYAHSQPLGVSFDTCTELCDLRKRAAFGEKWREVVLGNLPYLIMEHCVFSGDSPVSFPDPEAFDSAVRKEME